MHSRFRRPFLQIHALLRSHSSINTTPNSFIFRKFLVSSIPFNHYHEIASGSFQENHQPTNPNPPENTYTDHEALRIQSLLKNHFNDSVEEIEQRLENCKLSLSEDLILNVLKRHRSNWKPAYTFFCWVCKAKDPFRYSIDSNIYNEILDILGRMKRFEEVYQVLDEMSTRKNLINDRTYGIVVNRLAAGHKVDEAVELFNKIEDLGIRRNLAAFQTLLLSLCRYKHVETAEFLFRNNTEYEDDIKTWNIILNGWCVLRSLPDSKRVWKDIMTSNCKPDRFTYGIFINSLCKSGKTTRSMQLLRAMWEKGCNPDVTICNSVIDGLCFKKRIPEALEIFDEMNEKGCAPNIATYNSLVKHLCKIRRMEKVDEVLSEMEEKGCLPNALTYGYLLKAAKRPEEVDEILERMKRSGCEMEEDCYNLVLRLFVKWGDEGRVKWVWSEMERRGMGPDGRSYTVVIHGLCDRGRIGAALEWFNEMVAKGIAPESRTLVLVDDMKEKFNKGEREVKRKVPRKVFGRQGKKNR